MEKALRKIADIISDMSWGIVDDNDDAMAFFKGYLVALVENEEITIDELVMLMKFYKNLVANKKFIAE